MISILIISLLIYILLKPKRTVIIVLKEDKQFEFWDGPAPTKREQEQNLQRIFTIIEQFPDGHLAKQNPEYVDQYLSRIELDLPAGVEKSKE